MVRTKPVEGSALDRIRQKRAEKLAETAGEEQAIGSGISA